MRSIRGTLLLPLVLAAACSDATGSGEMRLSRSSLTLEPCETRQIKSNTAVTWWASNPRVAVVDSAGRVTARGPGKAIIIATDSASQDSVSVTVSPARLAFSVTGGGADTIDAHLSQPLAVSAKWSNGCLAVVTLRLDVPQVDGAEPSQRNAVLLSWQGSNAGRTDTLRRASLAVRLGRTAGTFTVRASVLRSDTIITDSVRYTVRAGAVARFVAAPRDTALYAGSSYNPRITVTDRGGNRTEQQGVTLEPRQPEIATASAAGGVRAEAVGRAYVRLRAGAALDSVALSVVPRGTLAAIHTSARAVMTFNLDGSDLRSLVVPTGSSERYSQPRWNPDGLEVVTGTGDVLYKADMNGVRTELASPSRTRMYGIEWPEYSRDGAWIYFAARYRGALIFRIRPDGTGVEEVTFTTSAYELHNYPSPSPDGTRLSYTRRDVLSNEPIRLYVRNLASGTDTELGVAAYGTRWSPGGDRIAFVSGELSGALRVIRPDGTGVRTLVESGVSLGVDWSTDGRWIVAALPGGLTLVNADTGELLPLPYTFSRAVVQPAWRR